MEGCFTPGYLHSFSNLVSVVIFFRNLLLGQLKQIAAAGDITIQMALVAIGSGSPTINVVILAYCLALKYPLRSIKPTSILLSSRRIPKRRSDQQLQKASPLISSQGERLLMLNMSRIVASSPTETNDTQSNP